MTDREKAIVMAYTGICMLEGDKLGVFYQYLEELYGRPVYTHEWGTLDIKEKSKPDFLLLCKDELPSAQPDVPDTNVGDIISRQAAIDAVISLCDDCDSGYCGSCRVNYPGEKDARKALEDLPSVPDRRWIPVSKKLPEDDTVVLVCGKSGGVYTAIHNNSKTWIRGWWKMNSKNHYCNPIAWMPLPAPWKGEQG